MSSSERDEFLYNMFTEWAKKHKKMYKTVDEENERFKIWCSTKEWVDAKNSVKQPGGVTYGLNFLSDLTPRDRGQQFRGGRRKLVDDPHKKDMPTLELWESVVGKEIDEEKEAFDKWVSEHNRNYGSNERLYRFGVYFRNKKKIENLRKENPGQYSTYPYELDIMMDQALTIPEFNRLVKGCSE